MNPEAMEGLGWVGHVLDDDRLTFDSRERGYRLYRERGDVGPAARVAAWHAFDCLAFRGEPAVANGWLFTWFTQHEMRGKGSGIEVEMPEYGWVATIRDRKMVRTTLYLDREEALEAAGLSG